MTGDTMTPNGFLLARIAEDEHVANEYGYGARWRRRLWNGHSQVIDTEDDEVVCVVPEGASDMYPDVIACWDPARVLAECETKRQIIRLHFRTAYLPGDDPDDGCVICGGWPCDTLRALALPYADHPDFPAALTADVNVR